MERFSEDADLLAKLRPYFMENGHLFSKVIAGKEEAAAKFRDYFDYHESLSSVPSHRALAAFRGRNEQFLSISVNLPDLDSSLPHPCEGIIGQQFGISQQQRAADAWLNEVVRWTWRVKLQPHLESSVLTELKTHADGEAIRVFGHNLKNLLMAAPAGQRATMGLDPGIQNRRKSRGHG
jgi:uncharacterized protein